MNRCHLSAARACLSLPALLTFSLTFPLTLLVAAVLAALLPVTASAQTGLRVPPIPPTAQIGLMQITQPPEALLNGQPVQLAPGGRIRGRDNLLLLSASLVGQQLPVSYRLDSLGLLHEVWVLSDAEIQAIPPR